MRNYYINYITTEHTLSLVSHLFSFTSIFPFMLSLSKKKCTRAHYKIIKFTINNKEINRAVLYIKYILRAYTINNNTYILWSTILLISLDN